jgi:hypothetical protein
MEDYDNKMSIKYVSGRSRAPPIKQKYKNYF